ncbi:hypothetical protein M2S00_06890 [Apilactobacillus sp. TMW 2.2459]|uniref:hypothetical protein n=1 Tax=Apilactobacillus xinyiensis TaxID=2841032 RepID=UPI00200F85C3|nr:hypothetical protein [Apilactobacillus xinyiensis]MCL0312831.1 hypothetical protein [Apilactobacillus xinyiensis]
MKQTLSSELLDYEQDRPEMLEHSQISAKQLAHDLTMCESNMLEVLITLKNTNFESQQDMKRYIQQVLVDNHENSLTNYMASQLLKEGVKL